MQWQRGRAYSQGLRDRVLAAEGSVADVGRRFGVSASYVCRVRQRRDSQGLRTTQPRGGHHKPRLAQLQQPLLAEVARAPDQTLAQLREWAAGRGVRVSVVTIHKSLKRWGLTLKKRRSMRPSKSA